MLFPATRGQQGASTRARNRARADELRLLIASLPPAVTENSPLLEEYDTAKPQENTWGLTMFLKQTECECPARSLQYISFLIPKKSDGTDHLPSSSVYAVSPES